MIQPMPKKAPKTATKTKKRDVFMCDHGEKADYGSTSTTAVEPNIKMSEMVKRHILQRRTL